LQKKESRDEEELEILRDYLKGAIALKVGQIARRGLVLRVEVARCKEEYQGSGGKNVIEPLEEPARKRHEA